MDPKKSNKIRDIVRLQQILKKWKRVANAAAPKTSSSNSSSTCSSSSSTKLGIHFLKRTLSFTDISGPGASTTETDVVPKGYLAVCVGKELKRFIIPTHYLAHQAFVILLREAEEEFGFQQEGVLQLPCEVSVFEKILNMVQHNHLNNKEDLSFHNHSENEMIGSGCCSPTPSHHPQMCR